MTIAIEETRIRKLLQRVDTIEHVANSLDPRDDRRGELLEVSQGILDDGDPVRPVIAAKLLQISEKTVRAWAEADILRPTSQEPRLLLDPASVHRIGQLLDQLREAGKNRDLLDEVWRRINDQAITEPDHYQEGFGQMRRDEDLTPQPMRSRTSQ
jgi:hypothetical protein